MNHAVEAQAEEVLVGGDMMNLAHRHAVGRNGLASLVTVADDVYDKHFDPEPVVTPTD